jgi:hypothetical protein
MIPFRSHPAPKYHLYQVTKPDTLTTPEGTPHPTNTHTIPSSSILSLLGTIYVCCSSVNIILVLLQHSFLCQMPCVLRILGHHMYQPTLPVIHMVANREVWPTATAIEAGPPFFAYRTLRIGSVGMLC